MSGAMDAFTAAARRIAALRALGRVGVGALHRLRRTRKRTRRSASRGVRRLSAGWRDAIKRGRRWTAKGGRYAFEQYRRLAIRARRGRARAVNALRLLDLTYGPPGEARVCPACGGRALTHLDPMWHFRRDASRYVGFATGCRTCGILFANPFPTPEALAEFYAPESEYIDRRRARVDAKGRSLVDSPDPGASAGGRRNPRLQALFASIEEELDVSNPPPGAKVLDFGCGPGRMLNRLQLLGWDTYGIEPAVKSAFVRHRELEAPPAQPTFSLILVHHVLEHVPNPLEVLMSLSRALLDGGFVYISVPKLDTVPEHGDLRYCINSHTHIVSYTEPCMRTLLIMAGLTPVDVRNDAELDRMLTGGDPRRLRLFARKTGAVPPLPATPLAGARKALRVFYDRHPEEAVGRFHNLVPVRLRAAWLQGGRTAERTEVRNQKRAHAGGSRG
jgi:SAM-dependent methyltransferase